MSVGFNPIRVSVFVTRFASLDFLFPTKPDMPHLMIRLLCEFSQFNLPPTPCVSKALQHEMWLLLLVLSCACSARCTSLGYRQLLLPPPQRLHCHCHRPRQLRVGDRKGFCRTRGAGGVACSSKVGGRTSSHLDEGKSARHEARASGQERARSERTSS